MIGTGGQVTFAHKDPAPCHTPLNPAHSACVVCTHCGLPTFVGTQHAPVTGGGAHVADAHKVPVPCHVPPTVAQAACVVIWQVTDAGEVTQHAPVG